MSSKHSNIFQFFEDSVHQYHDNIAIICDNASYTYQELNNLVNKFANYLQQQGIKKGKYVCVMLERSYFNYICMLALFKIGAVYVPVDPQYPLERIQYIIEDSGANYLISNSTLHSEIMISNRLYIDLLEDEINEAPNTFEQEKINYEDCYVIYTSGTTGKPKGVLISHQNICHYVDAASKTYEIKNTDRIYQGFSLSFDASMEEIWMAFAHGATLVPCLSDDIRSGVGLGDFLKDNEITVLSTVPSLLPLIDKKVSSIRLLLLGGEVCHFQQIKDWFSPHRAIFNTYGPTEATVVSTIAKLEVNKDITIGQALPGYETYIINENLEVISHDEAGELCIGGNAISKGYINLPELNQQKFIPHPADPKQKIYRTGDKVKLNANNQIQFLGRIDEQVKLRGFRIELNEIEARICEIPGIVNTVVQMIEEPTPTLIAFYELEKKDNHIDSSEISSFLQQKLPSYMLPSHFERIDKFPVLTSGKINKKALPKPNFKLHTNDTIIASENSTEQLMVDIWSEIFNKEISTHHHFFFDLGGHSLLAAQVISKLRKHQGFAHLSIKDLYKHPTISSLAKHFKMYNGKKTQNNYKNTPKHKPSNFSYNLSALGHFFGALFSYSIHIWPVLLLWMHLYKSNMSDIKQGATIASFILSYPLMVSFLMIAIKWLLLGKVKPGKYPLWGLYHFRLWLFNCIEKNFIYLQNFYGTPLINFYLRAMGAKIGKNVFFGKVSTKKRYFDYDLLNIGDNSSVGMEAQICTQYVRNGFIHIGPVAIGQNCFIGNRSLLKPHTTMQDNSFLDEMASLEESSTISSGEFYSGVPAKPNKRANQKLQSNFSSKPKNKSLSTGLMFILSYVLMICNSMISSIGTLFAFVCSFYFIEHYSLLFAIAICIPISCLLGMIIQYGIIKLALCSTYQKLKKGNYHHNSLEYIKYWWDASLLANPQVTILSDTIFAQYLLKFFGMKIGKNCEIGGFLFAPIELIDIKNDAFVASYPALNWPIFYNGSVFFNTLLLRRNCFIGNKSYIRSAEIIGEETLIGVSSITPDNHQAQNNKTSWVGIPPINLPVRQEFKDLPESLTIRPSKKLILLRMMIETLRIILPTFFILLTGLIGYEVTQYCYQKYTMIKTFFYVPMLELVIIFGAVGCFIILKWLVVGRLKPVIKPLWSSYIWKYDMIEYIFITFITHLFGDFFIGSVFFNTFLRGLGAKIGKKTYINTESFSEFDLIKIGSNVSIDDSTTLQCHLFEDRIYKTSHLIIEDDCEIGISSFLLYDTIMEKGASLGDKSLLMKGEILASNTHWIGSPAQYIEE